jgi:hypothetical protein
MLSNNIDTIVNDVASRMNVPTGTVKLNVHEKLSLSIGHDMAKQIQQ